MFQNPTLIAEGKSLNGRNGRAPAFGLSVNLAVFLFALKTGRFADAGIDDALTWWKQFGPAGLAFLVGGIANGLLSSETKARLVFMRWTNSLPGSFAFSFYAMHDPRIDLSTLRKKIGAFPDSPKEQNSKWYKLYRAVRNEPEIEHQHRLFLLSRDHACLSFVLLVLTGPVGFWFIQSTNVAIDYAVLLAVQYICASQAARNYGVSLVTTVMALTASR